MWGTPPTLTWKRLGPLKKKHTLQVINPGLPGPHVRLFLHLCQQRALGVSTLNLLSALEVKLLGKLRAQSPGQKHALWKTELPARVSPWLPMAVTLSLGHGCFPTVPSTVSCPRVTPTLLEPCPLPPSLE